MGVTSLGSIVSKNDVINVHQGSQASLKSPSLRRRHRHWKLRGVRIAISCCQSLESVAEVLQDVSSKFGSCRTQLSTACGVYIIRKLSSLAS